MNNRDSNRLDRHDDLIAKLLEQQIRTEEQLGNLAKSTSQRFDDDQEDIKNLQEYQLDSAKILSAMGVRLSVIQWIGITVGGGIIMSFIGYLIALLFQWIK